MDDLERVATDLSHGITTTLNKARRVAIRVMAITTAVGAATFLTGWWVYDGSTAWLILGGIVCAIPLASAVAAWLLLARTVRIGPRLLSELRTYLSTSTAPADLVIDHDSGLPLASRTKNYATFRSDLVSRRRDLPALFLGVRAITALPRLGIIAVVSLLAVGALGTLLLLDGLIN